jgi:ketosteroid isomerase-like protein
MNIQKIFRLPALLAPVLLSIGSTQAQSPSSDGLYQTIKALDTEVFNAYNRCDLPKFSSFFAEDLEFYHDKTGLTRGRQALVDGVQRNICGKVTRQLVPGTLEVYPIANYGAVEIGIHRFHHPGHDDAESVGEAKFVHLWQQTNGGWKITRVFSFDHQSVTK